LVNESVVGRGKVTLVQEKKSTDTTAGHTQSILTLDGPTTLMSGDVAIAALVKLREELTFGETYEVILRRVVVLEPVERKFKDD
jgi:ABC-type hemin transport system substrate-binding protein